jgi:hypothetical protein
MTPYEYLDVSSNYASIAVSLVMGYFSVLSAYFVVAYLVGGSLNRSQVIAVTGLFLVMGLFMMWGCASYMYASREYRALAGEWTPPVGPVSILVPLLLLGLISGLKFMWDVRHPKTE